MAAIDEVAKLIKNDWHQMEGKLEDNRLRIIYLDGERQMWKTKF